MAELVGADVKIYTDSELNQTFGEKKATDLIQSEINWKLPDYTIEYIESSCTTCTKAWYENGKIMMTLDLAKASNYVPGKTSVTKDVFIWLNDGEPRFVPGDKRQKAQNQRKRYVRVRLTAVVVL